MGGTWTSVTLRTGDAPRVEAAVATLGRTAYVSPAKDGWTCVFDEATESQDESEMVTCGERLTRLLQVAGLGVIVHDGDTLACWTFDKGRVVDTYESWPSYFEGGEPRPEGGDARTICRALGRPDAVRGVHAVLHESGTPTDATSLHCSLAEALGIPLASVTGYLAIERGDYDRDDPEAASFPMKLVGPGLAPAAAPRPAAVKSAPAPVPPKNGAPLQAASDDDMARRMVADGALPLFLDFIEGRLRAALEGHAGRAKGLRGQVPFLRALHGMAPSPELAGRIGAILDAIGRL